MNRQQHRTASNLKRQHIPGNLAGMPENPRWLTAPERAAWVAMTAMMTKLPAALDQQMQRDADLTFFEYMVLAMLSESPGMTQRMSDLAALTSASPSRLSHVASRLERAGFLARQRCPGRGRSTNAVLTDAGRAKVVFPVTLLIILALAGTSLLVRLGASDQGTQPKNQTSRRAYDLVSDGFGKGQRLRNQTEHWIVAIIAGSRASVIRVARSRSPTLRSNNPLNPHPRRSDLYGSKALSRCRTIDANDLADDRAHAAAVAARHVSVAEARKVR